MLTMMADYMENGFLENIIDLFRHDRRLYGHLAGLMSDERGRVRLGTVALVEALRDEHREEIRGIIPEMASVLNHKDPTIRADAAYILSVAGHREAVPYLKAALDDEHPAVRRIVMESIEDLGT